MKITALWPDGTVMTARSWQELEDDVRGRQWQRMSRRAFRREMKRRAEVFTGRTQPVSVSSAQGLFRSLEALDMVRLDVEEGDDSDDPG